ncbi:hypothetical protein MANAM107_04130 [Actinomyces capricornis]|uniref:M23ase beta-sheet core domain-containing protein n=1 Tax=Actinomyces capricornis TaxID=2755559 RepID=A0ABM7U806_9ACTO|nr:hypothetical protein MANAM107_04130 [Actinomyces capricornis]
MATGAPQGRAPQAPTSHASAPPAAPGAWERSASAPSAAPASSGTAAPAAHEVPGGGPSVPARARRSRRARGSRAALDASLDAALLAQSGGSAATPARQAPHGAASPGSSATGSGGPEPTTPRAGRARTLGAGATVGHAGRAATGRDWQAEAASGETASEACAVSVPGAARSSGPPVGPTPAAQSQDADGSDADRSWDSATAAGLSWKPIAIAAAGAPAHQSARGPQAQSAQPPTPARAQGPAGGAGARADEAAPEAARAERAIAGRLTGGRATDDAGAARSRGAAAMAVVSSPQRQAGRSAASPSPAEVAAGAAEAASMGGRELRFSRELEEFRSADTLQVPEIRRMSRKARSRAQDDRAQEGADTVRGESFGLSGAGSRPVRGSRRPTPARPSPGRRSASVLGRTAVLVTLAVATVIAPVSGQLTNAALASTGGFSQSLNEASPQASSRPSSVAAAVLGSDADLDEEGGEDLSNVPDAATLARIREAYQNAAKTCSSVTGASGDTSAFNSAPELFYPMLPDTYTISSEYGYRIHPTLGYLKLHAGQDLSAPVGTAIYAVAAGTVTTAGMVDGTGTVTIKHEVDGKVWYTSYLHMYEDGIYVKAGDTVTAGQLIAGVGNTGRSSGPHLHFEVRTADDTADESTVEPWGWLKEHNAVELTTNCS